MMEANGGFTRGSAPSRPSAVGTAASYSSAGPSKLGDSGRDVYLRATGIRKAFDATIALNGVDFAARAGCVNVLMGENGAGKSTLMKILAGEEVADAGRIELDGEVLSIRNPRDAAAAGIHIIHQELSLFPSLSVAENIYAANPMTSAPAIAAIRSQEAAARDVLERLHMDIDPRTPVGELPLGHQQMVEIARALSHSRTRVLIMDEPTSSLTSSEVASLFALINDLTTSGVSVIYISHRMNEIAEIGDYVTVFRDGSLIETAAVADVDAEWIVDRMMGASERRSLSAAEAEARARGRTAADGEAIAPVLEVRDLTVLSDRTGAALVDGVTFSLYPGERLGIYGAVGAGRSELLECLIGLRRMESGEVSFRGTPLRGSPVDRIRDGLFLVPEDRQAQGLFPSLSVAANVAVSSLSELSKASIVATRRLRESVSRLRDQLGIKVRNIELKVTTLSGGNQQKAILARALLTDPQVLLLDEPTRGIDVGSKSEIVDLLCDFSEQGPSVLFASSEIQEVLSLSHRILVLSRGRITGEFLAADATEAALLVASSAHNRSEVAERA